MSNVQATLQCGVDWWMQFIYTDSAGNPVALTAPKMEVRIANAGVPNSAGPLLYSSETVPATIVLTQPTSNTVLAKIASATTKNLRSDQIGTWDAYATDPSGSVVQLGSGTFHALPNVTAL